MDAQDEDVIESSQIPATQQGNDDVIESSQPPSKLRTNVRKRRINYYESDNEKRTKKRTVKVKPLPPDKSTVSQCLFNVWKDHRRKPATKPVPAAEPEDHFLYGTQQEAAGCVEATASVNLFAQQDHEVERYVFNQATEEQVEQELQELLEGFRASYTEASAKEISSTPLIVEPVRTVPAIETARTNIENRCLEGYGIRGTSSPVPNPPKPFVMPCFSEEMDRLEKILSSTVTTPQFDARSIATPSPFAVPLCELRRSNARSKRMHENITPLTIDGCLDLSVRPKSINPQQNMSLPDVYDSPNVCMRKFSYKPKVSQREDILDLRVDVSRATPRNDSHARRNPYPKPFTTMPETNTQAKVRKRFRNVGIQHRPMESFEYTVRNIVVLARAVECDPARLYRKLRSVGQSSGDPIWKERDLSQVFSMDDPYYANLKHFL